MNNRNEKKQINLIELLLILVIIGFCFYAMEVNFIFFIVLSLIIIEGYYMEKKRRKIGFLENGINRKLLFGTNVKSNVYKIDIELDKSVKVIGNMTEVKFKKPEINYWYLINEKEEILGVTFLIRESDAYQFEMRYDDYLKVKNEILEIMEEQDFEKALKKYFENASKNVKLVAVQFEDMLMKKGIDFEEIIGI